MQPLRLSRRSARGATLSCGSTMIAHAARAAVTHTSHRSAGLMSGSANTTGANASTGTLSGLAQQHEQRATAVAAVLAGWQVLLGRYTLGAGGASSDCA